MGLNNKTHEQRIDELITQVHSPFMRNVLGVSSKRAAYPKDCINNGALEQFIKEILELQKKAESNG